MNVNRKIQLAAAGVIVNGALGLGLLASSPALATTCGPIVECFPSGFCNGILPTQFCMSAEPPGCTFVSAGCVLNSGACGPVDPYQVRCVYK